jgi:Zn-dependent protease with chaperone function
MEQEPANAVVVPRAAAPQLTAPQPARPPIEPPIEGLVDGRPRDYPSAFVWLRSGIMRNLRGTLAALIATWFYLPAALASAALFAVVSGVVAYVYSGFAGDRTLPHSFNDVPLLGDAMQNLLTRSGGVEAAVLGVILGAALGFGVGVFWVFLGPFQHGVLDGLGTVLGALVTGTVVGLLYTMYRVLFEGRILAVTGARRPSRRERAFLFPLVTDAAAHLGLTNCPAVLIDDAREPNAFAYTRHIVVNQGLLEEFNYEREPIAAVLAHELVHWRNGDAISAAFVRGVALPLYLVRPAEVGWQFGRATRYSDSWCGWLSGRSS